MLWKTTRCYPSRIHFVYWIFFISSFLVEQSSHSLHSSSSRKRERAREMMSSLGFILRIVVVEISDSLRFSCFHIDQKDERAHEMMKVLDFFLRILVELSSDSLPSTSTREHVKRGVFKKKVIRDSPIAEPAVRRRAGADCARGPARPHARSTVHCSCSRSTSRPRGRCRICEWLSWYI